MVNSYCDKFDPRDPSKMLLSAVRSDRRDVDDEKISAYFDAERFIDHNFITSLELVLSIRLEPKVFTLRKYS